jgi:hydroxymethylbilane synthase
LEKATIVIGTRASALALWQAEYVKRALESAFPARRFVLRPVQTRGDLDRESVLAEIGTRGVFIKEIEDALLSGEIDLGVHSLKDLPSELHPELVLAATSPREDPRDVVVSRGKLTLADLPPAARIGSSSPRRAAQVKAVRPDLTIENIRGNVDTRVRRVMEAASTRRYWRPRGYIVWVCRRPSPSTSRSRSCFQPRARGS